MTIEREAVMIIRVITTSIGLLAAGYAFWDGTLDGGHILNPCGLLFLVLSGAVWFGWEPFRESFRSARDESDMPIIRLNSTLIKGLQGWMKKTPPARLSSP